MSYFSSTKTVIKNPPTSHSQKGVALITVLLLVVSITIVAGSMLASQQLATRKTKLLFNQDNFANHITSAEQLAVELIKTDAELTDFDSLQDIWAKPIPPYTTDSGHVIELTINDASSKFNLNNLYHDGMVDEQALASLERLLEALGIDSTLATAILDWQDPDGAIYLDGGEESTVYVTVKNSSQGSKIANQPFVSVEQLTALPDVSSETMNSLRPYVTAVPFWLPVNINTASEQVLNAITNNSPNIASFISQRENTPYASIEKSQELSLFETIEEDNEVESEKSNEAESEESNKAKAKMLLDVKSRAFETLVKVSEDTAGGKDKNSLAKYATFYVARGEMTDKSNNQNGSNSSNGDASNASQDSISVFSKRLWAFEPSL